METVIPAASLEEIPLILSTFSMKPCDWLPNPVEYPAKVFQRGHIGFFKGIGNFSYWVGTHLSPEWMECYKWSGPFREVYMNLQLRAILTYCEGDVDLTVDETDVNFNHRIASAEEYYVNH